MINIPPIKPSTEIKAELLPDVTKIWKVGQVLNARAETSADALSKAILRVGQYLVEARTPVAIKEGDSIKLLVKSLGETPLLSIQTPTSIPKIAANKLGAFIAQQQSLINLLKVSNELVVDKQTPIKIKQLISELINKLPILDQVINAKQLKQSIQSSGIFLESKIHHQPNTNIKPDLKAQLLKIGKQLQSAGITASTTNSGDTKQLQKIITQFINGELPQKQLTQFLSHTFSKQEIKNVQSFLSSINSTLLPLEKTNSLSNLNQLFIHIQKQTNSKQIAESLINLLKNISSLQDLKAGVEHSLAKITSQQLIPLSREADNFLLLLFDLLVKDKEEHHLINFKIEEERNHKENSESSWSVTINFSFKSLGAIEAKIHLIENRISTLFNAEKPETVTKIKQNIKFLETAYQKLGLDIIKLDISNKKLNSRLEIPGDIHILDENA
jgi:hypothetical protein